MIRTVIKSGNSSGVVLPRAMLGKKVRVEVLEKSREEILEDVLGIVKKCMSLADLIGVYLVGSYARGEEGDDSDIDVLVVSRKLNRNVDVDNYSVMIVSDVVLRKKLREDILPLGVMVREAVALLNSFYLKSLDVKVTRRNTKWFRESLREKMKLVRRAIEASGDVVDSRVVYTLVLRMRSLYLIEKLKVGKVGSVKEFRRMIEKIAKGAYDEYLAVKNGAPLDTKDRTGQGGGLGKEGVLRLYELVASRWRGLA